MVIVAVFSIGLVDCDRRVGKEFAVFPKSMVHDRVVVGRVAKLFEVATLEFERAEVVARVVANQIKSSTSMSDALRRPVFILERITVD